MHGLSGFLRRPFERGEIGEHPALRIQPVARFRLVERGLFDGILRKLRSNRHCRIQRNAPRERADQGAHIYVARAVKGSLDFLRRIPPDLTVPVGIIYGALRPPVFHFVAPRNGRAGAQRFELFHDLPIARFGHGSVIGVRQAASLREIGYDDVRNAAKPLHLFDERLIEMRVQFSVVAHDGVDDHRPAFLQKVALDALDHVDLLDTAEVAADDVVVFQPEALPVREDGRNIFAQIAESIAGKSARMSGKDGCGQNVARHARSRNNGQGNGQGAFSHAGDVVDG